MVRVFRSAIDGQFYKMAQRARPDLTRRYEAAGAITPTDVEDIEAVVILDELLGLQRRAYTLRNICRVVSMDMLTSRIDIATKLSAQEKVPAMVEADIDTESYTTVSFDLWKNVAHVAISDEAGKKAAHNLLQSHIQDAAGALLAAENSQIATEAEGGSNTSAGSDWGGSNNPYNDIMTAFNTIEGTGGFNPDVIAAHPYVWMDFFGNDYVKGQLKGEVLPGGNVFNVPGIPGVRGVKDYGLTNTIALVADSRQAIIFGEGPTEAASYRNETAGYDAYIIRQWLQPQIIQEDALYRLTGVHA